MNPKLKLFYKSRVVRYSKKKKRGVIHITVPKKFVGFSANIIIYSKSKRKK